MAGPHMYKDLCVLDMDKYAFVLHIFVVGGFDLCSILNINFELGSLKIS